MRFLFGSIFVVFFSACLANAAVPKIQQLAVSAKMACALAPWGATPQARIKCWGLTLGTRGRELPLIPFDRPAKIAVSESTICALRADKLQCFEYVPADGKIEIQTKPWFGKAENPELVTGGIKGEFCAYDKKLRMICSKLLSFGGPFIRPYALALSNHQQICALDSSGRYALNCIGTQDTACFETMKKIYFSSNGASELVLSRSRSGDCVGCVVIGANVRCWGDGTPMPDSHGYWPPSEFRAPKSISFLRVPCVVDESKVYCRRSGHRFERMPAYVDFPGVLALDGIDDTHCAINDDEALCHLGPEKLRIWHGLKIQFDLDVFDKTIDSIAGFAYQRKAETLRASVAVIPKLIASEKLDEASIQDLRFFVYLALTPFLETLDSQYFVDVIVPKYQEKREELMTKLSRKALRDFPKTRALELAALELIRANAKGVDKVSEDFLAKLGMAIATKAERNAVADFVAQFQKEIEDWQKRMEFNRTRGNVLAILALVEFLK